MAFKFIALFAVLALAAAGPQYHQHGLVKTVEHEEYADAPATYDFNYSVHDDHSGDIKQQKESAKDGVISGQYSLIDADGFRRIVDYTADDVHGFNAEVRREPIEGFKEPKVAAPVVHKVIAQPQYHSAPAPVKYVHAAPQYYSAPAPVVHKVVAAPQYYSAPAQVKYVHAAPQYYSAPAPVKYVHAAPQYYSAPAPVVAKVETPIVETPIVEKYESAPVVAKYDSAAITQVSFSGPSGEYHY